MRNIFVLPILGVFFFIGCNNPAADDSTDTTTNVTNIVPNKSISEKLTVQELSYAIESDSSFANRYELIREAYDELSEIEQAKYYSVTYDELNDFISHYGQHALFYSLMCARAKHVQDSIDFNNRFNATMDSLEADMAKRAAEAKQKRTQKARSVQ
jgi:hypothetical protein